MKAEEITNGLEVDLRMERHLEQADRETELSLKEGKISMGAKDLVVDSKKGKHLR